MNSNQRVLLEFTEQIYYQSDVDQMFSIFEKSVNALGFENVSYTYIPEVISELLSDVAPVFKVSKDYDIHFIDQYSQEKFGMVDFTIKRILAGERLSMNWWQEAEDRRLTDEERHVIQVARDDYGMRQGITIPTYLNGGSLSGVSVTCNESDQAFNLLYQERIKTLEIISRMFNDRLLHQTQAQAMFLAPILKKLTDTEKNVLLKLGQGVHLKQVARELNLDYKYLANNVVSSLRKKFGDVPRDQLLYKAGLMKFNQLIG